MQLIEVFDDDFDNFNKHMTGLISFKSKREFQVVGKKEVTCTMSFVGYTVTGAIDNTRQRLADANGMQFIPAVQASGNFNENGYNDKLNKELNEFDVLVVNSHDRTSFGGTAWTVAIRKSTMEKVMAAYRKYLQVPVKKQ